MTRRLVRFNVVPNKFVKVPVVAKKFVEVELVVVELRAVKFWRVDEALIWSWLGKI